MGTDTSKLFAGFQPIEYKFKREDLAVINVTSGVDTKAKIGHTGDLSSVVSIGDSVYLYSEGTNFTYNGSYKVITIVAGEITVDTPYIETGTGGYINYLKNYYVELECVNAAFSTANLLPFTLQSDGTAAGVVIIDVSIMNELNKQRGVIDQNDIPESIQEFEVKYRQVYDGSSESYTILTGALLIVLYAIEEPDQDIILNSFDLPKLYLGYPGAIVTAIQDKGSANVIAANYNELDINQNQIITGTLGDVDSDVNGFLMWEWLSTATIQATTKYIEFNLLPTLGAEYAATDYNATDYATT